MSRVCLSQVQELKSLETRVDSVEELVGDGLSSLKDSQTDLSDALTMAEQVKKSKAEKSFCQYTSLQT